MASINIRCVDFVPDAETDLRTCYHAGLPIVRELPAGRVIVSSHGQMTAARAWAINEALFYLADNCRLVERGGEWYITHPDAWVDDKRFYDGMDV